MKESELTIIVRIVFVFCMSVLAGLLYAENYFVEARQGAKELGTIADVPFYPEGTYDPSVPTPELLLGYSLGSKPASYDELVRCLKSIVESSNRVRLREYGETYEGRVLYYIIISSEANLTRLDDIKTAIALLADPRKLRSEREALSIIEDTPAVAWLAYSIHGDELSSTDAAMQIIYQLVAGTDSLTKKLREELVIIVDPLQNPDGRERFISQLRQLSGILPNPDRQSLQHSGFWPWGRGNHYLFDLNRDWISLVHPETRGRVKAILEWKPQVFIDAHEMGSFETYLFAPPNEPYNPNITETIKKWWDIFAQDQAYAFDQYGWSYYTREWYEGWYPGFGSHWVLYTGAIGILYEQAGVQGSLVKQPDGSILTYRESIHHHFVSSMANLTTVAQRRRKLLHDFYREKKRCLENKDTHPAQVFVFVPGENTSRANRFIETLLLQNIEVYVAEKEFVASDLRDYWGRILKKKRLPPGTYVILLDQPMRPLIQTLLDFDPRMSDSFLVEERRELEKEKHSRLYEVTAWSVPLAYALEAYWIGKQINTKTKPVNQITSAQGEVINPNPQYGYLFDYTNDDAIHALIMFLHHGYKVHVANKSFKIEGIKFTRGSVLLRNQGNPTELDEFVRRVAKEAHITIYGVNTALSEEGPDLGADQFQLLELPKIGIFAGSQIDYTSYGSLWYLLDREYQLYYSSLDINSIAWYDIDKYNLLILPQIWGNPEGYKRILGEYGISKLRTWIEQGGTLIAVGTAAAFVADSSVGLSSVRPRRQVLDKIDEYEEAVERELVSLKPIVDRDVVWGIKKPKEIADKDKEKSSPEEILEKDEKGRLYMPRGAILRVDLDQEHWLTSGMDNKIPVFVYTDFAFMSKDPVETAARFADEDSIRLSGLVWPEGRSRWAKTAYVTREGMGKGQIILFADEPYFRGYFHSSKRLFTNAIILGPGFGTQPTVPW